MKVASLSAVRVDKGSLENFRMTTLKYAWNAPSKPQTTMDFPSFSGVERSGNRAPLSILSRLNEFGGTELIKPT
jgi:hypothetical protein